MRKKHVNGFSGEDRKEFFDRTYKIAKTAVTRVVVLNDDNLLAARTNGGNAVIVTIEKIRERTPGVKIEFRLDSERVLVGRYDPDTDAMLERKRVRLDQGMINQAVEQSLKGLGL